MNLEDNKKAFMELLRIPSVTGSGADGEEKACAFLEHILQENGIKTERIAKDLHRPNLLAAIHAPRAEKEPVVLISHIDVVPGIQEEWTHPVFGAQKADGRIYGRVTLDQAAYNDGAVCVPESQKTGKPSEQGCVFSGYYR